MIIISYENFRKLANENNKRIYYYAMDNIIELAFVTDGIFTKTFVDTNDVDNLEVFFGQQMFVNSTKLLFRIPNPEGSNIGLSKGPELDIIKLVEPIESKEQEADLQKDGVKLHIPGV